MLRQGTQQVEREEESVSLNARTDCPLAVPFAHVSFVKITCFGMQLRLGLQVKVANARSQCPQLRVVSFANLMCVASVIVALMLACGVWRLLDVADEVWFLELWDYSGQHLTHL